MTIGRDGQVVGIRLSADAKRSLTSLKDRYGLPNRELLTRLLEWLVRQDEEVQAAALGLLPRAHQRLSERVLKDVIERTRPEYSDEVVQASLESALNPDERFCP